MGHFKKTRNGIRLRLDEEEAALARALMEQLLALIAGDSGESATSADGADGADGARGLEDELAAALGISERAETPDDPVLARLFPDAYRDDPEAAGEFRRYTEVGLRDAKRAAATAVLATLRPGQDVLLDDEQTQSWLKALNDVRLALGTRLDITEDWDEQVAELELHDPRYPLFAAYGWLSELQDDLIRVL